MQLSTYKIQKDGVYYLFENLNDDLIDMLANVRLHDINYVLIEIPTPSNQVRREIVSISLTPWGRVTFHMLLCNSHNLLTLKKLNSSIHSKLLVSFNLNECMQMSP